MTEFARQPDALHHYISFNGGPERIAWAEDLLVHGRAYLRSPLDFNDPFDCLPVIETPKTAIAWDLLGRRYREALREDFGSKIADDMWRSYKRLSDPKKAELITGASRASAEETGVFCLTEVDDSVLMWSHYADNHRGVCVTFDLARPLPSDLMAAQPVTYSEDRPTIPALRKQGETYKIYKALLRKANFWTYEREWRLLVAGRAHQHFMFPPELITSLIFGARCPVDVQREIRALASKRSAPVTFYQAAISEEAFKIVVRPTLSGA